MLSNQKRRKKNKPEKEQVGEKHRWLTQLFMMYACACSWL